MAGICQPNPGSANNSVPPELLFLSTSFTTLPMCAGVQRGQKMISELELQGYKLLSVGAGIGIQVLRRGIEGY